jgi:type I restriction enzyme S subunit
MESKKLEDWPITIIDGDRSSRYPKRKEMVNEGVLFLSTPSIVEGSIDTSVSNFITQEKFDSISKGSLQNSDIVMTTRGTIGKLAFFKSSQKHPTGLINAQMLILRPDPEVIKPKYLFYLMVSEKYQTQMKSFSSGSAQPQIPITDLRKTVLSFPVVKTQDAVVEVIDSYTNLIENNNRRIAILEDMAQSLYREWCVNFRYPNYQENLDADGNPKLIDSPLGQIPEGWQVKRLDDYVTLQRGFDLPKAKRNIEGSVPIYAASGLTGYHDEIKAKGPGIVTGRSGTLGIVKLVLEDHWPLNTSLWVKKFENCSAHYAYYLLDSIGLERFNSGASVPTLNRNDVHGNPVIAPPPELINKFEEIVAVKHKQINVLKRKNTNLKQQRDILLPKLISGQIEL